ncbi:MAG: TonB family protein [Candidatus Aquilonibacter sp.]
MRLMLFLACCLVLSAACGARALALAEFCPAEIEAPHQLDAKTGPSALFSYALRAEGPRSVAGSVLFNTSMGWFEVEFPATPLTAHAYQMQDEFVTFTRNTFESDPLYVRFPQPVTIKGVFVASATSSGDQVFGWDAKGTVQCAPRAGFGTPPSTRPKTSLVKTLNPRTDLDVMPGSNAVSAVAAITSAPGSTDCDVPFANASVEAASPEYPLVAENRAASVWVEVAVNADGTLADAWIYAPSGSRDFDAAALRAARLSKFKGGRVFCQPAGGDYLFHAVFNP